ncbi:MAG: methyltransferase domain-containing protein [Bacteroidota bacterium]
MHPLNSPVEQYYYREGIFETIVRTLDEQGIKNITRRDISTMDEFHVRGAAVSAELAKEAGFTENSKVLDVGCGIGGPCRMLADEYGCKVTGIDITAEFIRTAGLLSELVGLNDLTDFIQADALQLPFEDKSFDFVWTQHVQMNIENKNKFYSEIERVLTEKGVFIYYDIFSRNKQAITFPVPWAGEASLNHLTTTAEMDTLLSGLSFIKIQTKDQTGEAIKFFTGLLNKQAKDVSPKMKLNLLMENAGEKIGNLLKNIKENKLELQSGIYKNQ